MCLSGCFSPEVSIRAPSPRSPLPPLQRAHLATYSVGFDFAGDTNELRKAGRIANRYGTDHHEIHIMAPTFPSIVEKDGVYHHDILLPMPPIFLFT